MKTEREEKAYHRREAARIQAELDALDPNIFHPDGIVRWVLQRRIDQERRRAEGDS